MTSSLLHEQVKVPKASATRTLVSMAIPNERTTLMDLFDSSKPSKSVSRLLSTTQADFVNTISSQRSIASLNPVSLEYAKTQHELSPQSSLDLISATEGYSPTYVEITPSRSGFGMIASPTPDLTERFTRFDSSGHARTERTDGLTSLPYRVSPQTSASSVTDFTTDHSPTTQGISVTHTLTSQVPSSKDESSNYRQFGPRTAGVVFGSVAAGAFLLVLIYCVMRRKKNVARNHRTGGADGRISNSFLKTIQHGNPYASVSNYF
ncbi:hypothetical protein N7451_012553 [Penicillium sp. IBT 35674x]|nr:hypothetical protein N7451_012553 [Penicillium sp. IBT 35674x]